MWIRFTTVVVLLQFAAKVWRHCRIYFHQFRKVGDTSLVDPDLENGFVLLLFAAKAWRHRRIYFHQFRKVGDTSLVDPNHDNGCLTPVRR